MSHDNTETDFYARAITQLGRTLRAIGRYESSHRHEAYGRARIDEALGKVREAMGSIGAAHKAAEVKD